MRLKRQFGRIPKSASFYRFAGLCLLLLLISCAEDQGNETTNANPNNESKFALLISNSNEEATGDGKSLFSYSIDTISGLPSFFGSNVSDYIPPNVVSITASSTGEFVYLATEDDLLYSYTTGQEPGFLLSIDTPINAAPPEYADYPDYSIVMDPLDEFLYVIGYYTVTNEEQEEEEKSIIETFSRDKQNGLLTLKDIETSFAGRMYQLEFSPSGEYAYGATQTQAVGESPAGVLNIFKFDRIAGTFDLISSVSFRGWTVAPFHPITIDPTGKFLYLVESAGFCEIPPDPKTFVQNGSRIITYLIDYNRPGFHTHFAT